MSTATTAPPTRTTAGFATGPAARRVGCVITTLMTLFFGFDAVTHVLLVAPVVEANAEFGAPPQFPVVSGVILSVCLIAYLVPASRAMGTILLTTYLGGAVAANLIAEQALGHTGFAIITAVLVWAGAWPRDTRLRALLRR